MEFVLIAKDAVQSFSGKLSVPVGGGTMLRRKVHRVAVVARGRVVRLRLCVGLSPSAAPLAAGLGALRPLRPRPPVAVDRARLLVARVNLHIKVAMSYLFSGTKRGQTHLISTINVFIPGLEVI